MLTYDTRAGDKGLVERKIANYLQNYARRNRLTVAEAKARFFTETHEKFVESVPHLLKQLLDEKAGQD